MAPKEIFVPLIFNNNYLISNYGQVIRSKSRWKSLENKPVAFRSGGYKKRYLRVSICNKDYYIHRLVLEHFSGPCPSKDYQCAHLDGNSKNNYIGNLKWCTPLENSSHKILHGTSGKGELNSMAKISNSDTLLIITSYQLISSKQFAEHFNVSQSLICGIASGKIRYNSEYKNVYKINSIIAKKRMAS